MFNVCETIGPARAANRADPMRGVGVAHLAMGRKPQPCRQPARQSASHLQLGAELLAAQDTLATDAQGSRLCQRSAQQEICSAPNRALRSVSIAWIRRSRRRLCTLSAVFGRRGLALAVAGQDFHIELGAAVFHQRIDQINQFTHAGRFGFGVASSPSSDW